MRPVQSAAGGVWTPRTAFPGWVQAVPQVFPMYWLRLGMRSALLPDAFASIEICGSDSGLLNLRH